MESTKTFHATCHCARSSLSFTVPASALPLSAWICHCDICRRTHGTLCTIHARIPAPEVDLGTFSSYQSSAKVRRLFCTTCGAHMLDNAHDAEGEEWYVAASLVDAEESTWRIRDQFLLQGTKDGGLGAWLASVGEERLRLWKRGAKDDAEVKETGDWEHELVSRDSFQTQGKKLKVRCHCGGVQFDVAPPRGPETHDGLPDYATPKNKKKWFAVNDTCTSCRLVSSCVVTPWAIVEMSHITLADGSPYKPTFGSLKAYNTSEAVDRTFCGTCGATVTYRCDERPSYVDVAVGLLDAESGVRAEEWLEWTYRFAYEGDCKWEKFIRGLKQGLQVYDQDSE